MSKKRKDHLANWGKRMWDNSELKPEEPKPKEDGKPKGMLTRAEVMARARAEGEQF